MEEQEQNDGLAVEDLDGEDDPWHEGGWFFDLPDGAWERQEAKNRALRQNIRANVKRDAAIREAEAKKNPFTGPNGSFGGWVDDVVAEPGPAGKPAEVWGVKNDEGWEDDGPSPAARADEWGAEPPSIIVEPPPPGQPAWEFPADGAPPPANSREDEEEDWGAMDDEPSVPRRDAFEPLPLGPGGLPPLRRNVLPPPPAKETPAEDEAGEKRSRWDEMFGGVQDTSIVDSMREWQEREKEELAKARDINLLAPELLAPFDWELAEDDKKEAGVPAGVLFTASYTGEGDDEDGDDFGDEVDLAPIPSDALVAGWKLPVAPRDEWGDEGKDELLPAKPAPVTAKVEPPAMPAASWDGFSEPVERPAAKKSGGGFMSRLLGKKEAVESPAPGWSAGSGEGWEARESAPRPEARGPRPPAPTPSEGEWEVAEGRDDDTPLIFRPAPVAPANWAPATEEATERPAARTWGAPPTDEDGSVHYDLPKRFRGRNSWDDDWLENLEAGEGNQPMRLPRALEKREEPSAFVDLEITPPVEDSDAVAAEVSPTLAATVVLRDSDDAVELAPADEAGSAAFDAPVEPEAVAAQVSPTIAVTAVLPDADDDVEPASAIETKFAGFMADQPASEPLVAMAPGPVSEVDFAPVTVSPVEDAPGEVETQAEKVESQVPESPRLGMESAAVALPIDAEERNEVAAAAIEVEQPVVGMAPIAEAAEAFEETAVSADAAPEGSVHTFETTSQAVETWAESPKAEFEPVFDMGEGAKPAESSIPTLADTAAGILHAESESTGAPETAAAEEPMAPTTALDDDPVASEPDDPWAAFLAAREPSDSGAWITRHDREERRAG